MSSFCYATDAVMTYHDVFDDHSTEISGLCLMKFFPGKHYKICHFYEHDDRSGHSLWKKKSSSTKYIAKALG